jgi:hypothetical protein
MPEQEKNLKDLAQDLTDAAQAYRDKLAEAIDVPSNTISIQLEPGQPMSVKFAQDLYIRLNR